VGTQGLIETQNSETLITRINSTGKECEKPNYKGYEATREERRGYYEL